MTLKDFFRKLQVSIAPDKINHFAISYILMHILDVFLPLFTTTITVVLIGLIKEFYIDEIPDKKDLIADALGIILYLLVICL